MMDIVRRTLGDVDLVLWLVEPKPNVGAEERKIAETLSHIDQPVILVINKADTVSRDALLPVIMAWKDAGDFAEIVPVSAWKGTGCDDLVDTIFKYLPYGPMFYDEDTVTDETEREIAAEVIREKSLYVLQDEIPHGIAVTIEKMHERPGKKLVDIEATIYCERESHKGIIIGKQGSMLKRIGSDSRYELEKMLDMKVNLKLWVKVQKGWRDQESSLKKFGYRKTEDE
jgi:GTP-binding protein Era